MSLLSQPFRKTFAIFSNSFYRSRIDKDVFIIYKIVDSLFENMEEYYIVQCINTKAILKLKIEELVYDFYILHGLHPIQSCFIGIEYARNMKINSIQDSFHHKFSYRRYGDNNLLYQDRAGQLGFENVSDSEVFIMDPRDIALSRELIENFDAAQAFCIGILAGLKLAKPLKQYLQKYKNQYHLSIVK
ncbi:MAG: hypothetical protein H0U75_06405 [Legionella sp.]|nr:hypothetical protein [Legionella sp.]